MFLGARLNRLLSTSEHIPKANTFGEPCIDPKKQIAVAIWALANQESSRQIADRLCDVKFFSNSLPCHFFTHFAFAKRKEIYSFVEDRVQEQSFASPAKSKN